MILLLALLLAQTTASRPGQAAPMATNVQGVAGGTPIPITGTISASSSVHSNAAAPTYVEGTDNPFSSDLGGALRVLCMGGTCGGASPFADGAAFTAGTTSVGVTAGVFNDSLAALVSGKAGAPRMTSFRALHLNLRDNSGNEIPFPAALDADLGFKVHVQNTVAVTGPLTDAQLRASAVPTSDAHTTAAVPLSLRLSDGAAFYDATKTGQLPAALDGSGFLKVHEQGSVTVSNAFALDATLTGGTAKAIVRGGAKGATAAADATSTANGVDHQGLDVQVQNASLTVAGTVTTTPPANASTNVAQFGAANVSTGVGAGGAGIPRVTVSNDSTVGLVAGSAIVGKVGIDQTTPGTTNLVAAGQNGTWTVQPGNTQNTTPWLTTTPDTTANTGSSLSTACADPGSGCAGTAVVSMAVQGIVGIGAKIVGSALVGDQEACDISYDGATTWVPNACAWHDPTTERTFTGKLSALASTTVNYTLIVDSGITHVRIRMAVLTSGTATVTLRGVTHAENLVALQLGVPGQLPPPASAQLGLKAIANAAAPTNATAGNSAFSVSDLAGRQMVQTFHPNLISCNVAVSTATTITAFGGSCAAPGASLSIYITDLVFSASAASGTAADAMPTIKYGTGGTCGTGTTVVIEQFNPANGGFALHFSTPFRVPANNELCWIDSTAGSKAVHIQGFLAP